MITVKVTFSDNDSLVTGINTDLEGAKEYYIGKTFNLGGVFNPEKDRMVQGVTVELIN